MPASRPPPSATGLYTAPSSITTQQTVTVTAVSQADNTRWGHYVLQLSASDGELTSTVQLALDVQLGDPVQGGWIGGVQYGADVSGVVPISVAPGITLVSGVLKYYPAGGSLDTAAVLNSNTTGSGTIGTLDTTLLANGAYFISLDATDSTGSHQYNLCLINVVAEYKPGRMTATAMDLVVPAMGLPIRIERRYDSLERGKVGDFGYGWSLSTRVDLQIDPKSNVIFTLGGRRRTFYFTPRPLFPRFPGIGLRLPAYTAEPGLAGTLTSGAGCFVGDFYFWDVLVQVGSMWMCNTGGSYTPRELVYTDATGTQYTMGGDGTLKSIKDLSGNTLTVTPAGISASNGLSVPFARDAQGRITQITDPLNNKYLYATTRRATCRV